MDDYAPNDHIFSNQGKLHIMSYIKCDISTPPVQQPQAWDNACIHWMCIGIASFRESLIAKQVTADYKLNRHDEIIWSATELNEAEIRFKKNKTTSLKDISFARESSCSQPSLWMTPLSPCS
ncbi:hypothetical protein ACFX2A_012136 [Malus domestica]